MFIFRETILYTSDNSGVRRCKCIHVETSFSKTSGTKPATILLVSVRRLKLKKKLKKGDICRGILIRTKKNFQRKNGVCIRFNNNSLILIDKKNNPIGTRIFGAMYRELKELDLPKLISASKSFI